MSSHEKNCPCGYVAKNPRGLANHRRHCQMYKDALNLGPTKMPRGPIDRSRFMQAPTQVINHAVLEEPGLSLQFEEEAPFVHSANATNDIPMVHSTFFLLFNLRVYN